MQFREHITQLLNDRQCSNVKQRIAFVDGNDSRAINAAKSHYQDRLINPILILEKSVDRKLVDDVEVIVMEENSDLIWTMAQEYYVLRAGKNTLDECMIIMTNKYYFAIMLLKKRLVDGVIGGLTCPTADTLRPAFRIIGPVDGVKNISSVIVMTKNEKWYLFTDVSVIPQPTCEQVVEIAINAMEFAKLINLKIKPAFLSFSTLGSTHHPQAIMMRDATSVFNSRYQLEYPAIGEIQFDAAFDPVVRHDKYKAKSFVKEPTVFIFPSLESGNIGYKIAQRLGGFDALGPVITGLAAPVNDLSRGSTTIDVYLTALITALQAVRK